jgi:polysaccharide pyruvyl transferase WcaK-like protein
VRVTKIVQFGLPYSPNLGDGVISDCLVHGIRQSLPGSVVETVDLSGRRERGQIVVRNRAMMLKILEALPGPLRHRLVEFQLGRVIARALPNWRDAIRDADMAFIGGGQLFSDADLNFCLKIAAASDILREADLPVAVHAVGVARNWSPRGTELFARVLATRLRWIGVRDRFSESSWRDQMPAPEAGETPGLEVVHDPGLLAEAAYGRSPAGDRIGVCVTAPLILAYHSDSRTPGHSSLDLLAGLADRFCAQGHRVSLFCNGAAEDQAAQADLAAHPRLAGRVADGSVVSSEFPATPVELARLISGFRGVVSHRLHACILAFAYGIPAIGIGWDRKVQSFYESVGRPDMFMPARDAEADRIAAALQAALERGIAPEDRARILADTQAGIDRALEAGLGRAIG